jgi:hypothetical protein
MPPELGELPSKLFSVVWSLSAPHCQNVVVVDDGLITETLVAKKNSCSFSFNVNVNTNTNYTNRGRPLHHASTHRKSTARPYNSSARTYV